MRTSVLMGTLALPGWDSHVSSILDQTVPADEVLVVVDRPTDAAEQAGLKAAWPRLSFLFNETNVGLTRALNRGFARARGEFIFRADDDDFSYPSRIERQLETFHRTGADFVSTWGEGIRPGAAAKPYLIRAPEGDKAIKRALKKRNVLLHPSLAFRRETVERLGGYDENFIYAQDYALYLAGIRSGATFAVVPEILVRREYGPTSISVARRGNQLMYSCAAQVLHSAQLGDRKAFLATLLRYGILAAVPTSLRRIRRWIFSILGRGV
jgi:glycosyltransferase involved in cell wall biosynthesis